MEKASCGEGAIEGAGTAEQPPLGGLSDDPGHDHVVRRIGRIDHLAHEDESQRTGMAFLVGAEPAPQHAGPLLVVDSADAEQVRVFVQVEASPCRLGVCSDRVRPRLLDPETHEDLACVRDAESAGDQRPFRSGLEDEGAAAREQLVEDGQVQGRLLVRGRVHHGALVHQRQPAHGRVVQVRVEDDDVGVARLDGAEERGGPGPLEVDQAFHVLGARVLGI